MHVGVHVWSAIEIVLWLLSVKAMNIGLIIFAPPSQISVLIGYTATLSIYGHKKDYMATLSLYGHKVDIWPHNQYAMIYNPNDWHI